jgi:hypothetical protein
MTDRQTCDFARHYLEMLVATFAGMGVLGTLAAMLLRRGEYAGVLHGHDRTQVAA